MYNVRKNHAISSFRRLYRIYMGGLLPEKVLEYLAFIPIERATKYGFTDTLTGSIRLPMFAFLVTEIC